MDTLITKAERGLQTLHISDTYRRNALASLTNWLTQEQYRDYRPQIEQLIANEHWGYLLDSFYQTIPFGTGGRRGEVGVGPNRINPWTIKASAQGHSQYLLNKYGDEAKSRGIVFAYDVREFTGNKYLSDELPNPVKNLTSKDLAVAAAGVYATNGIKVHIFDDVRTTPELSFAIRHIRAVAGAMFSASHNPPAHNGKKVYDESGGQLIPPHDEELVMEVTQRVTDIREMPYDDAANKGLIVTIDRSVDEKYIESAISVSLSDERDIGIVYTPLHGCGTTSVLKALESLKFRVLLDPKTSNPSGKFENIIFNIPNPEVIQTFDTAIKYAADKHADIILNTDPDADRIGIMVKHAGAWVFLNGNEIAAILAQYVIQRRRKSFKGYETLIKTTVTSSLLVRIAEKNNVNVIGELLIGFKYIGDEMNNLEKQGKIDGFLFGCEESHGYLAGNYARDKDAVTAAVWLSELAAELKKQDKTLVDFLNDIYAEYGYFSSYMTEIRLLGASGKEKIDKIQGLLRANPPNSFGTFPIQSYEDCRDRKPIVSETDRSAKDVLIFRLDAMHDVDHVKVVIRPSGTEPKIKIYFEIGATALPHESLQDTKERVAAVMGNLEKAVMLACYKLIDIDFPERGFLLFWQLPLEDKMKYFEIESGMEKIKDLSDAEMRRSELSKILAFLGSNPLEKMGEAFKAKYKISVLEYLNIQE